MLSLICDRCGKLYPIPLNSEPAKETSVVISWKDMVNLEMSRPFIPEETDDFPCEWDLCPSCMEDFKKFLMGVEENGENKDGGYQRKA